MIYELLDILESIATQRVTLLRLIGDFFNVFHTPETIYFIPMMYGLHEVKVLDVQLSQLVSTEH